MPVRPAMRRILNGSWLTGSLVDIAFTLMGDLELISDAIACNPDWLAASCRKGVRCEVLLVSGHFAGTEFYASRPDLKSETLPVDVLECAACSDSCPGLFEDLKD